MGDVHHHRLRQRCVHLHLNVNHPSITILGLGSSLDHVITYTITDGQAVDSGTITVRIFGAGDPPVIAGDPRSEVRARS